MELRSTPSVRHEPALLEEFLVLPLSNLVSKLHKKNKEYPQNEVGTPTHFVHIVQMADEVEVNYGLRHSVMTTGALK